MAAKGHGQTLPNPMVGAVLVKNGKVIAEGYHKGPGKPHAEIEAIRKAGKKSIGADMYVNLEPCCHIGKTGPCTDAIIKAGVKGVTYAATDANPLVNGKGATALRRAGIKVTNGLLSNEAARLNEAYFGIIENQRPYVTLKLAQSLDGRIATSTGDSKWISSERSRKFVHRLRADADAVLVGMETIRRDNPQLTNRMAKGKNPYRIIVTRGAGFPKKCQIIEQNEDLRTIIASTKEPAAQASSSQETRGATHWGINKNADGTMNIYDFLQKAKEFGLNSILVEGGARMATSFLKAKLVDKIIIIIAPIIIGKGIDSIGELGISCINKSIKFRDFYRFQIGQDHVFVGYPDWSKKDVYRDS